MTQNSTDLSNTRSQRTPELEEAPWFGDHWADMASSPAGRPAGTVSPITSLSVDRQRLGAAGRGFAQAS